MLDLIPILLIGIFLFEMIFKIIFLRFHPPLVFIFLSDLIFILLIFIIFFTLEKNFN